MNRMAVMTKPPTIRVVPIEHFMRLSVRAMVIYSLFVGMGLTVIAEDASSRGRLDMSIQIKDKTYVLEFKVVDHKSSRNSALEQIIARNYAAKYTGAIYQIVHRVQLRRTQYY